MILLFDVKVTPFWCKSCTILVLWVGDGLTNVKQWDQSDRGNLERLYASLRKVHLFLLSKLLSHLFCISFIFLFSQWVSIHDVIGVSWGVYGYRAIWRCLKLINFFTRKKRKYLVFVWMWEKAVLCLFLVFVMAGRCWTLKIGFCSLLDFSFCKVKKE